MLASSPFTIFFSLFSIPSVFRNIMDHAKDKEEQEMSTTTRYEEGTKFNKRKRNRNFIQSSLSK
jgi:hypothetical protein